MNQSKVITVLKEEAKKSAAANAVFHLCALRKRNRATMNIAALAQKMKKEGFDYPRRDYENVLKTMASLGLGDLSKDSKGHIKGLKDIKVTLQSIGKAACSTGKRLDVKEEAPTVLILDEPAVNQPESSRAPQNEDKTYLMFFVAGKAIKMEIPNNLNGDEISALVNRIKR